MSNSVSFDYGYNPKERDWTRSTALKCLTLAANEGSSPRRSHPRALGFLILLAGGAGRLLPNSREGKSIAAQHSALRRNACIILAHFDYRCGLMHCSPAKIVNHTQARLL
jgi:hypothetical protein